MPGQPRALVIGGSVGGLFAASLLRRCGWDATVFEHTTGDLAGRGAGLGLSAELFAVMRRAGARVLPSTGVPVGPLLWLDRAGGIAGTVERGWVTGAWGRIYRPLRDAVPDDIYRAGWSLERVEQDGAGVTAVFAGGRRERGDLLVAADGVHSTVRRQFLPAIAPRYAGYVAWRGLIEEGEVAAADRALLLGRLIYSFPPGEMTLSTSVPGAGDDTRPGHRRYYWIWYRPAEGARAMPDLLTDASGRNHGLAIPPTLIRPALVAALRADAAALLPPPIAAVVRATTLPLLQPITDLEVPRMVFGRVALLGDAAFIARPHVAAGITKAALDAALLADALADTPGDVGAALERYDRERSAFGTALCAYSRYLGERSLAGGERDPATLIGEYGAPHLVHEPGPDDLPQQA